MIALKLVLNQDPVVRGCILAENVGAERPDLLFLRFAFQIDADGFAQQLHVSGRASQGVNPNTHSSRLRASLLSPAGQDSSRS